METIKNQKFGGERPLFGVHDVRLEDIEIVDGESGIKCCKQVECHNSKFYGKYPWWHVDGSLITNCYFAPGSRSAIWYSDDMVMRDCVIDLDISVPTAAPSQGCLTRIYRRRHCCSRLSTTTRATLWLWRMWS